VTNHVKTLNSKQTVSQYQSKCDPLSKNMHSSHNLQFLFVFSALSTVLKEWVLKISAELG